MSFATRLLELRPGPQQALRVYEGDGGRLHLAVATAPVQVVVTLSRAQVGYLIDTLADWVERGDLFSSERSAAPDRGAGVAGGAPTGVNEPPGARRT